MRRILFLVLGAVAALPLAACAYPLPGVAPLQPALTGTGPPCGPQQYPFQALHNFQRGQAVVQAEVGPDARLVHPVVEQPAGDAYLTDAARRAVLQCSMPAARPGSQVRLLVVFDFRGQEEYLPRGDVFVFFAPPPR